MYTLIHIYNSHNLCLNLHKLDLLKAFNDCILTEPLHLKQSLNCVTLFHNM